MEAVALHYHIGFATVLYDGSKRNTLYHQPRACLTALVLLSLSVQLFTDKQQLLGLGLINFDRRKMKKVGEVDRCQIYT